MKEGTVIYVEGYPSPFIVRYVIERPVYLVRCRAYYSEAEYEFPYYKILQKRTNYGSEKES
jgi:hypothetical protein